MWNRNRNHLLQSNPEAEAGGGGEGPWGSVPDDIRAELEATGFKGTEDLAKGYLNAQRRLGASLVIPGEDSSEEDRLAFREKLAGVQGVSLVPSEDDEEATKQFYSKLGWPEKPDGYELSEVPKEKVAEYLGEAVAEAYAEQQKEFQDGFRAVAHDAKLSAAQVKKVNDWWNEVQSAGVENELTAKAAAAAEVAKHLGEGRALEAARVQIDRFIDKFAGEELAATLRSELDRTKLGNVPALTVLLYKASQATLEEGELVKGGQTGANDSEFAIQQQLDEILNNQSHPYWAARSDPGHEGAVRKVAQLQEQLRRLRGQPENINP